MAPLDQADVQALLSVAKAGDSAALGRLLERYRSYLLMLVRVQIGRRLQGKVDATDVLQEAFLQAHRNFGRFRGASEPEWLAWLREILASVLANQVRRFYGTQSRDPRLERELAEDVDRSSQAMGQALIAPDSSPSRQAARKELSTLLTDALDRLPDDYREVIILRQLEELPFADVARRMDRTEDSVKNLWARALGRLRRAMEDHQ